MSRNTIVPFEWVDHEASDRARRAWQARHANDQSKTPRVLKHPACADDVAYSDEQLEYMQAIEAYKKATGVRFLTVCEHLHILMGLGYQKVGLSA